MQNDRTWSHRTWGGEDEEGVQRSSLGDEQHGGATCPKQIRERMSTVGGKAEFRFEHVEHFQVETRWAELVRAWLQRTTVILG